MTSPILRAPVAKFMAAVLVVQVFALSNDHPGYNDVLPKTQRDVPPPVQYSVKHHPRLVGRHVCVHSKVVTRPVRQVESYCKPVYKTFMHPCGTEQYRLCSSHRVVYERAVRTVHKVAAQTESMYACCPGWSQESPSSHDCKQALCTQKCKNRGVCVKPDHCACPPGWTGKACDVDIDECQLRSTGCDHQCANMPGKYLCTCNEGFSLQADSRSCRVNTQQLLKNTDFLQSYEELTKKVMRLEKLHQDHDLADVERRLDALVRSMTALKKQVSEFGRSPPTPPTGHTSPEGGSHPQYESTVDRINSLSEQISMLEERLEEGCKCNADLDLEVPPVV